jgi:predicted tellurium resistance membrane protein TerC
MWTLAADTVAAAGGTSIWDFSQLVAPENLVPNLVALLTLTLLEVVLGIDNIVFIAILAGKLPKEQQDKARKMGLMLAVVTRVGLLMLISFVLQLAQSPIFSVDENISPENLTLFQKFAKAYTWKDLIITIGGLFLIFKAVHEIHAYVEGDPAGEVKNTKGATFNAVIVQILAVDMVFSIDSVITAVGMAQNIYVMILAVLISVGVMLAASGSISRFIHKHPTMKMLALSFLLMIGILLIAESFGAHISKGYLYFAMAFSLIVEVLNIRSRKKRGLDKPNVNVPVAE